MTAQSHEILIIDGSTTSMAFCPPLPVNDPLISTLEPNTFFLLSCLWRGYIGTWEIKEGKFYLNKISSRKYKLSGTYPTLADWFTGTLRIPQGVMLQYIHMGFAPVFEKELHIKIEKGLVIKSRTMDNSKKHINEGEIGMRNFPGCENRFDGDDVM